MEYDEPPGAPFFAFLIGLSAPAARAGHTDDCAPRAEALENLETRYREIPVGIGVTGGGGLLVVTATADGSTWTLVAIAPGGMACAVAAGQGWRQIEPREDGDPL